MGRDDRQNIRDLLPAGSDLPARGKGVTVDNANGKAKGKAPAPEPKKPDGYKGRHEGRPGKHEGRG